MRDRRMKRGGLGLMMGLCAVALSAGLTVTASAQDTNAATETAKPQSGKMVYYVDFRARTAASYGHAFVWFGRSDQRQIEVAGLHPASESVIPYIIGHVLPVMSETGKSYGDLDEQYLTASYRVYMSEAEGKRVFAYIKHLQATSPVWNAATWNCVAFIQSIAREMGLRVPGNHLLYPEDWVNQLRALNGGRRNAPTAPTAQGPAAPAPAIQRPAASARKPAAPTPMQTVEANPRT
jgi:hypothetical protein